MSNTFCRAASIFLWISADLSLRHIPHSDIESLNQSQFKIVFVKFHKATKFLCKEIVGGVEASFHFAIPPDRSLVVGDKC